MQFNHLFSSICTNARIDEVLESPLNTYIFDANRFIYVFQKKTEIKNIQFSHNTIAILGLTQIPGDFFFQSYCLRTYMGNNCFLSFVVWKQRFNA